MKYALLRKQFLTQRKHIKKRSLPIEKILVSKGLVTKEEFDVAISRINDLEAELETIKLNLKKQVKHSRLQDF